MERENLFVQRSIETPKEDLKPSFLQKHWDRVYSYAAAICLVSFGLAIFGVFTLQFEPADREDVAVKTITPVRKLFAFDISQLSDTTGGDVATRPPKQEVPPPEFVGETLVSSSLFTADAIAVRDVASGKLLYQFRADEQRPIASITKLMSTLIILERRPNWTATSTVVTDDLIDNHMYAGDTYTQEELWNSALVASSNKAVFSLADAVGISRASFADRMNSRATELGMSNTRFVEPTGLDEGNVSTAAQLTKLLSAALEKEEIRNALLTQEYTLYSKEREVEHHMWNTNWLMLGWIVNTGQFEEFLGGKTGYIPAAGYNFAMRVANAEGNEIDVVVLGTDFHEARFEEARDIAGWVFENYQWPEKKQKEDAGQEDNIQKE
ncbi:D-alanyl-D-alanine carboxypeptidase [Candidatus Nomurabacteria bacterium]|nr:D-alanyl-D-alanine carboxypeptidase [Candidatus Nomurabacteria bacterium]